jgi:recombinational DNA repair protein (RecF pathway)
MQEYVTKAVVLDKQTQGGHADARYAFFTERFGKVVAKATSSRKIVSKLAGHLEPGTLVAVRIIEQHGTRVVDALAATKLGGVSLRELAALAALLPEWQPERELWEELARAQTRTSQARDSACFSWSRALAILGWDPEGAICASCNQSNRAAPYFFLPRQEFFCKQCVAGWPSMLTANQVLLMDES